MAKSTRKIKNEQEVSSKSEEEAAIENDNWTIERTKRYSSNVISSAFAINLFHNHKLDINTLIDDLSEKVDKVIDGDIRGIESMLVTQAKVLDSMFKNMILNATNTTHLIQMQTFLKLL